MLPKGKIDSIKHLGQYTARIKTLSYGPDEFLLANKDTDNVTCRVPDKFNRSQGIVAHYMYLIQALFCQYKCYYTKFSAKHAEYDKASLQRISKRVATQLPLLN